VSGSGRVSTVGPRLSQCRDIPRRDSNYAPPDGRRPTEHPHANVNQRALDELRPLVQLIDERVELTDQEHDIVTSCLSNAILAGVRIGVAEALAQATEQGFASTSTSTSRPHLSTNEIGNDPE
jgi:hypothetical protein